MVTATAATASTSAPRWSLATRIAFRFSALYFGLTILSTQLFSAVFMLPSPRYLTGFNDALVWVGTHVFRISRPIPMQFSGSGDKLIDWVLAGTLLLIALLATIVWSLLSRRASYPRMNMWFRLLVRFALGATLVRYGLGKVIPLQMPTLFLARLVEPFGNFSPMGVLWYSIGASPAYEAFIGAVELLAGVLLFFPRTTLLGALIGLAATGEVFVLNMTYDVPVKLLSFHLVLLALFLLAPYARNLCDLLLFHRPLAPAEEPPVGSTPRRRRYWLIAQAGYGTVTVALALSASLIGWLQYGAGAPKSPLYGIWDVEQMTIDGELRPPLVTDDLRWRRVIMQTPDVAVFQKMDDTLERYGASFDKDGRTLKVTPQPSNTTQPGNTAPIGNTPPSDAAPSTLTYSRPSAERLVMDGTMDGRVVHLELKQRDLNSFVLNSRGFHWIQEVPFNR